MSGKTVAWIFGIIIVLMLLSRGCGGGKDFEKSALDNLIQELPKDEVYTIVLNDMDVRGNFSKSYYHDYEVISGTDPEKIDRETTGFLEVSEGFFNEHINNMGMEIASRDSTGKLNKTVAPAGYTNYIGNPKYGQWKSNGSGGSFWEFYGKYAFMSSMFNLIAFPARYNYYNTWRTGYYGYGRPYYGPSTAGSSYYGTSSRYNTSRRPNSTWSSKQSTFSNRVQNRTSRSSGTRSSSSSSYRSRGGSFGK